eukprot:4958335-Alexandrium_andersonii.AAC.1
MIIASPLRRCDAYATLGLKRAASCKDVRQARRGRHRSEGPGPGAMRPGRGGMAAKGSPRWAVQGV